MTTKAEWFAKYIEWSEYVDDYMIAAGLGSGAALAASYYDGELGQYWLADYTGDTTTYHARADTFNTAYAVNYGRAYSWGIPGYWSFGEGLAERYIRQADANALSDLQDLCASAAYHVSGSLPGDTSTRHELSREWAYCGVNLLQLKRIDSLSGAQQTRLELMYSDSLLIIGDWAQNLTASYYRPFMGGITARFLIQYYELEADAGERTAIQAALEDLADYTWTACWDEAGAALLYTDRIGVNPPDTWAAAEDGNPAADLSMLSAPLYAWLWSVTANSDYYTKATQLLDGALPAYNEYGNWQSGAYLGTRSADNPNGKHVNQNLILGAKVFWDYLGEDAPSESPGSGTSFATNGLMLLGCGCGAAAASAAAAFDPTDHGTVILWQNFTDSTKTLKSGGSVAADGEKIDTITDSGPNAYNMQQTTDNYRPVVQTNEVNGLQIARFDAGDGFGLSVAQSAAITKNKAGVTMAFVLKPSTFAASQRVASLAAPSGNPRIYLGILTGANFQIDVRPQDAGTTNTVYTSLSFPLSTSVFKVVVMKFNWSGNAVKVWVNDDVALNDTDVGSSGNSSNTDPTGGDSNHVYFNYYGTNGLNGDLGEWVVWDTALADATIDTIRTELYAKYGITP